MVHQFISSRNRSHLWYHKIPFVTTTSHAKFTFIMLKGIVPGVLYFVTNLRISPLDLNFFNLSLLGTRRKARFYMELPAENRRHFTVSSTSSPPNNNSLTFAYTLTPKNTPIKIDHIQKKHLKKKKKQKQTEKQKYPFSIVAQMQSFSSNPDTLWAKTS